MSKSYFSAFESVDGFLTVPLQEFLSQLNFNQQDLIPAIIQCHQTRQVLMMGWMNQQAIINTLTNGRVCFWSRSRNKYWYKGEESGNIQYLKTLSADCDGDTLLLQVEQMGGGACHTGKENCFFWQFNSETQQFERI